MSKIVSNLFVNLKEILNDILDNNVILLFFFNIYIMVVFH